MVLPVVHHHSPETPQCTDCIFLTPDLPPMLVVVVLIEFVALGRNQNLKEVLSHDRWLLVIEHLLTEGGKG